MYCKYWSPAYDSDALSISSDEMMIEAIEHIENVGTESKRDLHQTLMSSVNLLGHIFYVPSHYLPLPNSVYSKSFATLSKVNIFGLMWSSLINSKPMFSNQVLLPNKPQNPLWRTSARTTVGLECIRTKIPRSWSMVIIAKISFVIV